MPRPLGQARLWLPTAASAEQRRGLDLAGPNVQQGVLIDRTPVVAALVERLGNDDHTVAADLALYTEQIELITGLRALGRDSMGRRFDRESPSYWEKRKPPSGLIDVVAPLGFGDRLQEPHA